MIINRLCSIIGGGGGASFLHLLYLFSFVVVCSVFHLSFNEIICYSLKNRELKKKKNVSIHHDFSFFPLKVYGIHPELKVSKKSTFLYEISMYIPNLNILLIKT